jgi:hypothetical protein
MQQSIQKIFCIAASPNELTIEMLSINNHIYIVLDTFDDSGVDFGFWIHEVL